MLEWEFRQPEGALARGLWLQFFHREDGRVVLDKAVARDDQGSR